jgi:hypothetical protein
MAHSEDGGPLHGEPMKVYESFLRGERLRPLREKPLHIKRSPSVETTSTDE